MQYTLNLTGNAVIYSVNGGGTFSSPPFILTHTLSGNPAIYTVVGTSSAGCTTSKTYSIYICEGIHEYDVTKVKIKIYPNPANDHFTIETPQATTAKVFGAVGQEVAVIQLQSGTNEIETKLSAGIYFVQTPGSVVRLIIVE
jgi:hypothetical protein